MCCITFPALEVMMTTTELTAAVNQDVLTPWLPQSAAPHVRMNWVVVNDENQIPKLRMLWNTTVRDDRTGQLGRAELRPPHSCGRGLYRRLTGMRFSL